MLSANEIAQLAQKYGKYATSRESRREIEDQLLTGDNHAQVGLQCARFYEYLDLQWERNYFMRSLEQRADR